MVPRCRKGPEMSLKGILTVVERCFTAERIGSGLTITVHMAPVFLHISCKLLSVLIAEQHGVYSHSLPGFCVRKCGNRSVCVGSNSDRAAGMRITTLQSLD